MINSGAIALTRVETLIFLLVEFANMFIEGVLVLLVLRAKVVHGLW